MRKLNGWQRLWLLASTIWLAFVAVASWTTFPTVEKQLAAGQALSAQVRNLFQSDVAPPEDCFQYNDIQALKDCTKAKLDHETWQREERRAQDDKVAERVERGGTEVQTRFAAKAIIWWLVPTVCAYLLGLGVAWIRKGFSNPN